MKLSRSLLSLAIIPALILTALPTGQADAAMTESYSSTLVKAGGESTWNFEGKVGDFIAADVTSDFDSYLYLKDESGNILAGADDCGLAGCSLLQPLISGFRISEDGTYRLVVGSYAGAGSFTVSLTKYHLGPPETMTAPGSMETELPTIGVKVILQAPAGKYLTVRVAASEGSSVDPSITLYDASGSQLAMNDDVTSGNRDAEVRNVRVSGDRLTLILGNVNGAEGNVTITTEIQDSLPTQGTLWMNRRATGTLTAGETEQYWKLRGTAGSTVSIRAFGQPSQTSGGSCDTTLTLIDPAGSEIASDDDSLGNYNPLISGVTIPVTDEYLVRVAQIGSMSCTSYGLRALLGTVPAPTPTPVPVCSAEAAAANPVDCASPAVVQ